MSPLDGEQVVREAARLHVVSPRTPWSITVRAAQPFASVRDPSITLGADRLRVAVSGQPGALPLAESDRILIAEQPPTGPEGRWVTLDYTFHAEWGDRPLASDDAYSTRLMFTVVTTANATAYALPNPFSADGDGVQDETSLRLPEGTDGHARLEVLDARGAVITGQEATLTWDGTDRLGLPVPDGNYLLVSRSADGASLGRATVMLQRTAPIGTGRVVGIVRDSHGIPVEGVTVELRASSGVLRGSALSDAAGRFEHLGVGAGRYALTARRELYFTQTTPQFDVADGESARRDLQLIHNHSLIVSLHASDRRVSPGAMVQFEARVRAVGTTPVDSVRLQLTFGAGLRPLPASFQRDGARMTVVNPARVELGPLAMGAEARVRFMAVAGAGAGTRQASASVLGVAAGEEASAGPATVSLNVSGGELAGRGGVYGRVCYDLDGDQRCGVGDPGVDRAVVFLEEGSFAQGDRAGRFHFAPLVPGRHVLLAGPGPLQLSPRGGPPALPRAGSAHSTFVLPAGQYVRRDVALTPPEGFIPEAVAVVAEPLDPDEGDVMASTVIVPEAVQLVDADEGSLDDEGRVAGLQRPMSPGALPLSSPTDAVQGQEPALAPVAIEAPSTTAAPSTAYVGVGEATLNVGLDPTGRTFALSPTGRLGLTVQHDFGAFARGTLTVDTARAARSELLAGIDRLGAPTEFGDDAQLSMHQGEKLALRIDLPGLYAQLGRAGALLHENELLYFQRSVVGAEVGAGGALGEARVFGGFASEFEVTDSLRGQDSTGPYNLTHTPILPGSERVEIELRAAGRVVNRIRLAPGVDYYLDSARGTVHLTRPLFGVAPSGEEHHLVVHYQVITDVPLFTGFVGGGRASIGDPSRRLGVSGLYQRRTGGDDLAALAADGRIHLGPLRLEVSAGWMPLSEAPLLDRSAARARLAFEPVRGLELFGFGAHNGRDWEPEIRSTPIASSMPSQLSLLDGLLGPAPLSTSLSLAAGSAFPVLLEEDAGSNELGGGARIVQGPARGLTLFHRRNTSTGSTDHAEAAVIAAVGGTQVYAAHGSTAAAGELIAAISPGRTRQTVAGAATTLWELGLAADYRNSIIEGADGEGRVVHEALVRARYERNPWLQPAAMIAQRWSFAATGAGTQRELIAGFESHPSSELHAFAFGRFAEAEGTGFNSTRGAFAGISLRHDASHLQVRYDLAPAEAGLTHQLSWSGRSLLPWGVVASTDGQFELPTGRRLVRAGLAFRPLTALQFVGRAHEELDATGGLTRLGTLDASLRIHPRVRLDAKYLYRWQRIEALRSVGSLAGVSVTTELFHGLDVLAGGRYLRDVGGSGVGGQLEIGYTLAKAFRIGVGANVGTRSEVFSIAGQTTGLYVNLSAADAGHLRHGAAPKASTLEAPAQQVVATSPAETDATPPPAIEAPVSPSAAVPPSAVRVTGRLYADRNSNATWDADEPVFEGVPLLVEGQDAVTDKKGQYRAEVVAASSVRVAVKDATRMPYTHLPVERVSPRAAGAAEVTADLLAPKPEGAPAGSTLQIVLADGKSVRAEIVDRAEFPLAAWIAGLPLDAREATVLQDLATRAMEAGNLRLVILARAQSTGPLGGAVKRAWRGGQALKRYLQATQMVPPKRMSVGVLEPEPTVEAPLGKIELVLVRVQP